MVLLLSALFLFAGATLETLAFDDNSFSGAIPGSLFTANTALDGLYMDGNSFSGAMPAGLFSTNTSLDLLYMFDNQFTSGTSLTANTSLDDFRAYDNNFDTASVDQLLLGCPEVGKPLFTDKPSIT